MQTVAPSPVPTPPSRPRGTARRLLVLLVLGLILPFLAMSALRARERAMAGRAAAENRALELAELVAARVDDRVGHIEALLTATITAVQLNPANAAANDSILLEIKTGLPRSYVTNLWLVDAAGHNIGTSYRPVPPRAAIDVADREYFQRALSTRRPTIGDPVRGRPDSTRWSVTFARPVIGSGGEVRAVILGTVHLAALAGALDVGSLPDGSLVTLVDERGTLLGRSAMADEWVGRNVSYRADIRDFMQRGTGVSFIEGLDGIERVSGFTRAAAVPWQVYVGTPRDVAFASATGELRRDLILAGLTLIVALLLAGLVARRLTQPLDALTADALAFAAGDLNRRSRVGTTRELTTLADAFNVMAETVESRTAELHRSERAHRQLFDTSPLPMYVYELNTLRFVAVNDAAVAQYGYSRDELLALRATDIRPPEERLRLQMTLHTLDEMQRDGDGSSVNAGLWRHRRKDGTQFEVEVFTVVIAYEGRPARLTTVIDVSARRRAEQALAESQEQLRRAQKMEALGRFAGGIAHDFNNLLTGILGYCDLALDDLAEGAEGRAEVTAIRDTARRAASLTQQILAFSRRQVLQPSPLDLNAVVRDMQGMVERLVGAPVQVELQLAPSLGSVVADRGQLEQVLMNLIVNARDAMPDGGQLRITTGELQVEDELPASFELSPGRWVCLAVHDSGIGMEHGVQAQIFEPFFTTKERGKGTGLGLATVDGIVQQSGGRLQVESAPGMGSTFRVFLPARAEPAPARTDVASPTPSANRAFAAAPATILLVEDEDAVRAVAESALRRRGFTVIAARDGEEALALADAHDAPLDLLLTDVVMPGMSGPQLADCLRVRQPELRVLFASGYTDDEQVLRGVATDELAFLPKPFTPEQLAARVNAVLAQHAGDAAHAAAGTGAPGDGQRALSRRHA